MDGWGGRIIILCIVSIKYVYRQRKLFLRKQFGFQPHDQRISLKYVYVYSNIKNWKFDFWCLLVSKNRYKLILISNIIDN